MSKSDTMCRMDKNERAAWAGLIERARKARHWTQEKLASKAGVSLRSVGYMETGETVPQEGRIELMRRALDLPALLVDASLYVADMEAKRAERDAGRVSLAELSETITSTLEDAMKAAVARVLAEDPGIVERIARAVAEADAQLAVVVRDEEEAVRPEDD